MRILARSSAKKGEQLDWIAPLSKEAQRKVQKNLTRDLDRAVISSYDENPIAKSMGKFLGYKDYSLLRMTLTTENRQLGQVVLIAKGFDRYFEKHADLLTLLQKPFAIAMSNVVKHNEMTKLRDLLADDNRFLHNEIRKMSCTKIVGADFGMRDVMHKAQQVAILDSPVLIMGATGTGKDVIADTIHYSSARSNGPFISVNCGAIPESLIDSELFGHEKGAFTGALSQKRGRFERAHKGTIFLDEIGELPPRAQVRLLRVLQNKEIERVGGTRTIALDIRIIAATNRNLEEMVKERQFREDLWFRLNVFPIKIPPLCERKMDIPALVQHFIGIKARELKLPDIPKLSPGEIDTLTAYRWPGNVRELQNVIERAMILNPEGPLTFENLNPKRRDLVSVPPMDNNQMETLDEMIARHIRLALSKANGKVNGPDGAAALLGINPSTLRHRMRKLGIDYGRKNRI